MYVLILYAIVTLCKTLPREWYRGNKNHIRDDLQIFY